MFGGLKREKAHTLVVRDVWKIRLEATRPAFGGANKRKCVNQAKVFKAHAVPHGLCGNVIGALKLLANQQEDGDGLIQNIVTNLSEVREKVSGKV